MSPRRFLPCYVRSRSGRRYSEATQWISGRRSRRAARRITLAGTFAPEYRAVVDAFIENFKVEDEVGAACSIVLDGATVVDIWGGWRDRADAGAVGCADDRLHDVASPKASPRICFNMLIDRGLVDPNARVIAVLARVRAQRQGEDARAAFPRPHRRRARCSPTNPLWPGAMFDREAIVRALEEQEPLWEIGTKAAYHVHHQGFLLGEIMRRVTGKTVGPFLREEVAAPLGAEYYIGGMTHAAAGVRRRGDAEHGGEAVRRQGRPPIKPRCARARFKQNPNEPWADDDEPARVAHRRGRKRQRPRQRARRRANLRRAWARRRARRRHAHEQGARSRR